MKPSELLADPKHWCRGVLALTDLGECISPKSSEACQWCLIGACVRCEVWRFEDKLRDTINRLFPERIGPLCSIAMFNDHKDTIHEDVIRVLKETDL